MNTEGRPLEYQARTAASRHVRVRRWIIAVVLLITLATCVRLQAPARALIANRTKIRALMDWRVPPADVLFEFDPERRLNPPSGSTLYRPYNVGMVARRILPFDQLRSQLGVRFDPMLVGTVHAQGGDRIIVLGLGEVVVGFDNYMQLHADVRVVDPGSWYGKPVVANASAMDDGLVVPTVGRLRIYGATPDPNDPAALVCRYDCAGREGRIHIRLQDNGSVTISAEGGPLAEVARAAQKEREDDR